MVIRTVFAAGCFAITVLLSGTIMTGESTFLANSDNRDIQLDAILAGEIEGSPPLSGLQLLVLRDGEIVYEYAGGFARLTEQGEVPLNTDHKMRVASISKLVAAIGLMRLVEAGKVDLDRDVSDYLGFSLRNPNFPDTVITLRMVLSHTSSIRDGDRYWLEEGAQFHEFFMPAGRFFDSGSHFASGEGRQPGRYFAYCNLNFGIVAAVIERVSGQRFDRFMRREVLEPLGLAASYNVCDLSATQPERIATLYRKRDSDEVWQPRGDWVPQLDFEGFSCHYGRSPVGRGEDPGDILPGYTPGENPTLFSPQGGLRASARDLAVIARMLLNNGRLEGVSILSPQTVEAMAAPQWPVEAGAEAVEGPDGPEGPGGVATYGLAVRRADLQDWGLSAEPRALRGHLGEAYGLLGQFWLDMEHDDALIALITGSGDDPGEHMGTSPLYRPEEEIMKWWLRHFPR
jgi:CubicO group peptidase (beta-lactamase class C family)